MSKRIPQLPSAGSITGAEIVALVKKSATVTITASTLSALASDNSYNDSANGFVAAGFAVGDAVAVVGFTGNAANNIQCGVITILAAGKMTIGGTDGDVLVDDAAGESVTISKLITVRAPVSALGSAAAPSSARTKTLGFWAAAMLSEPPAANFATLDTRNSHPLCDLDDTTDENFFLSGVIPQGADLSSGITIETWFGATSATTGNAKIANALENLAAGGQNIDSDGFDTEGTAVGAANATSGKLTKVSVTLTTIAGLAAGDPFRLKCGRRPSDTTNDTMTGDAEIIFVHMLQVA